MSYKFLATIEPGKPYRQQPFNVLDIKGIDQYKAEHIKQDTSLYESIHTFSEPVRSKDNVEYASAIFIDFDNHWTGYTKQDGINLVGLLEPHFNVDMPTPKEIRHSGRGLHFYIALDPSTDIAKYELVAKEIAKAIDNTIGTYADPLAHQLDADMGAIGAERVIRVLGSWHPKAHVQVSTIYESHAIYALDDLITNFLPGLKDIAKGKITAQAYTEIQAQRVYRSWRKELTAQTWRISAIKDLQALQSMRDNVGVWVSDTGKYHMQGSKGYRNAMLFVYGKLCKYAYNDPNIVMDKMLAFGQGFKDPLDEQEIQGTYNSIMSHQYSLYTGKATVQILEISGAEMQGLKVLIDRTEIKRRKRIKDTQYNATRYAQKAQARATSIASIKYQAISMHNAGMTYRAIADSLHISLGYAHKLCN